MVGSMGSPSLDTVARAAGKRDGFYLALALAMSGTVFLGFWFTYFGPLFRGVYPPVEPIVHVHGWTFFLWYLLLPTQAGLIRSGRVPVHRALGLASIVLAAVMIAVGLIVSTVQIDLSLRPDGSPFWTLMGVPIFSIWVLFTVFYATAIARRRRPADHKRLMVLASAVAMSAVPQSAFRGAPDPGLPALRRERHDARAAPADAELDPPLPVVERLVGDHPEASFRMQNSRARSWSLTGTPTNLTALIMAAA